jgi:general stress protein 13
MKIGDIVKGKITGIKPYGAFVKIEDTIDGLIHISEMSDGFVRKIEDYLNIGDCVDLEVIRIAKDNKVSLSYKSIHKQPRKKYMKVVLTIGFQPLADKMPEWIHEYQQNHVNS